MIEKCMNDGSFRVVLHHARLCLMLGDHNYSSQKENQKWPDTTGLFANTDGKLLKQKLDEHLVGVMKTALHMTHSLPRFEYELPKAEGILALKKSSPKSYDWQNKAVDKIKIWQTTHNKSQCGFFAVNMASTGCGKTFANAKIIQALSSKNDCLRYTLALGLRTLTLQTGDEYRERIGLDNNELAVVIGSKAIMDLHHQKNEDDNITENSPLGADSLESLIDEDIDFDCEIPEESLTTVLEKKRARPFLYAPVVACTIDHMMAATETRRGGRYILPVLRLMSSDLVIDEVDDFTGSDLIAVGRLVFLAGMLGRKVMISSATIPPDLAEGYFNAYSEGWKIFTKARNATYKIGCAWIDEFKTSVTDIDESQSSSFIATFRDNHQRFIAKRVEKLSLQPAKRKADIINCETILDNFEYDNDKIKQEQYFEKIKQAALSKHQYHHTIDNQTNIKVSFGVVRMANIAPCVAATKYLMECEWPTDVDVKIMAYHSQQVMLLRHEQERHLDRVLKRKEKQNEVPTAFQDSIIRSHLDISSAKEMLFIVVATPVEEVGRDHDFDWAAVEPTSYRSIIQLSGRVRRHRVGSVEFPNISLLQYNWRTIRSGNSPDKKYFNRPGYEDRVKLDTHDLYALLDTKELSNNIDAIPRIQKKFPLNFRNSLIDLEHKAMQDLLTNYENDGPETLQGYLTGCWYLTALPQVLNPFRKSEPTTKVFLMYEPDIEGCYFIEKDEKGFPVDRQNILQIKNLQANKIQKNRFWLERNYQKLLEKYADHFDSSMKSISLRFGELNFVHREGQEYVYSDQFGLLKT